MARKMRGYLFLGHIENCLYIGENEMLGIGNLCIHNSTIIRLVHKFESLLPTRNVEFDCLSYMHAIDHATAA